MKFEIILSRAELFKNTAINILITVNQFSSRGHILFRGTKLLADRMHEMHSIQVQREQETLDNVKAKVARIKANQRKFEPDLIAAKTHHEGNLNERSLNYSLTLSINIFLLNDQRFSTEASIYMKNLLKRVNLTHGKMSQKSKWKNPMCSRITIASMQLSEIQTY